MKNEDQVESLNDLELDEEIDTAAELEAKIKELEAQKVRAKSGKKDKSELASQYKAFINAKKIYDNYQLSIHRDQSPRYFYKLLTTKRDRRSSTEIRVQDIRYFSHGSLYPNFVELENNLSKAYLRKMIEGGALKIQRPTGEIEQYTFERRVYDKMTNTTHQVDDKTYNLVDLSSKLVPEETEDANCPIIIKALLYSITGNVITWNDKTKEWDCSKPETLEWFEKWLYGAVHANIGDFSMSMPILFGPGKVGKNALFDILMRQLLGTWCCFSSTWDIVDSNFTAFKLGKVFMFIDEIPERSEWTKIKNATGSTTSYVKEKYGPEFEIDNCVVYAMGSNNHTFPLPWEDGEQMMRVSPIKTHADSTFAGNTVKMLNKEFEAECDEPYVDMLIRAYGNDPAEMTEFQKGDYVLRHLLAGEWQSRDAAQKLLNYLHKKFSNSKFHLSPLRSVDWEDIKETKVNGLDRAVELVAAHMPEIISISELYEIYTVATTDHKYLKQKTNFTTDIRPRIENLGYDFKRTGHLAGNIRDDVFIRKNADRGAMAKHHIVLDRYIKTDGTGNKQVKYLTWPSSDEHYEQSVDGMFKTISKNDLLLKMTKKP